MPSAAPGPKRLGGIILIPLALFALIHIAQAAWHGLGYSSGPTSNEILRYSVYFRPDLPLDNLAAVRAGLTTLSGPTLSACLVELVKWCTVLAIALWLTRRAKSRQIGGPDAARGAEVGPASRHNSNAGDRQIRPIAETYLSVPTLGTRPTG
jgi:hypothetical protein